MADQAFEPETASRAIVLDVCASCGAAGARAGAREKGMAHTREGEARFQLAAIIDASDDAIMSKTTDGILTSWNRGAERIYGYTAEEALGRHISFLIPPFAFRN